MRIIGNYVAEIERLKNSLGMYQINLDQFENQQTEIQDLRNKNNLTQCIIELDSLKEQLTRMNPSRVAVDKNFQLFQNDHNEIFDIYNELIDEDAYDSEFLKKFRTFLDLFKDPNRERDRNQSKKLLKSIREYSLIFNEAKSATEECRSGNPNLFKILMKFFELKTYDDYRTLIRVYEGKSKHNKR